MPGGADRLKPRAGIVMSWGRSPSFVRVRPHPFDVARNAVGLRDVEFELETFNRFAEIRADDRRFASAAVDQRMMRWLLEPGPAHGFQLHRGWLLAWMPRLQPLELERASDPGRGVNDVPDGPPARPDVGPIS